MLFSVANHLVSCLLRFVYNPNQYLKYRKSSETTIQVPFFKYLFGRISNEEYNGKLKELPNPQWFVLSHLNINKGKSKELTYPQPSLLLLLNTNDGSLRVGDARGGRWEE